MKISITLFAALSIVFLIGAGAMGLHMNAAAAAGDLVKPSLKRAHLMVALTGAGLSILTRIMSLIYMSKMKTDTPAA